MSTVNPVQEIERSLNADPEMMRLYRSATLLGVVAGLRSSIPFAFLSLGEQSEADSSSPLRYLLSPQAKSLSVLSVLGEVLGDKLPFTPSRLKSGPFAGRVIAGALAGVILFRRQGQSIVTGALLGGVGAIVGSVAGNFFRTVMTEATPIPDFLWALVEDAVALYLASEAVGGPNK